MGQNDYHVLDSVPIPVESLDRRRELIRLLAAAVLRGVAWSDVRLTDSAPTGLELRRHTVLSVPGVDRSESLRSTA